MSTAAAQAALNRYLDHLAAMKPLLKAVYDNAEFVGHPTLQFKIMAAIGLHEASAARLRCMVEGADNSGEKVQ